jgi:DNA-binding beta-propeller fold protein YncE
MLVLGGACGRGATRTDNATGLDTPTSLVIGASAVEIGADPAPSTTTSTAPADETTSTGTVPESTATSIRTTTTARRPTFGGNVYAGTNANNMSPAVAGARPLVYVPHEVSGDTWVIDPTTMQVIATFRSGAESQHVVPSWDLKTLYVVSSRGSLVTPIDPTSGQPGTPISVSDVYNLYFLPDGSEGIVVAEGDQRFDFVDPHTFARHSSLQTRCPGLNHLDFAADYSYFVATCEFEGTLIKVDVASKRVVGKITIDMRPSGKVPLNGHAQPQDIRVSPDGSVFYVADLQSAGVYLIDAATFTQSGYIPTGIGTHGLYPSRDGTKLYVVNRGTPIVGGPPHGQGSISVLDFSSRQIVGQWDMPGGGSPDMGNLTADGTQLWLGGRYDGEVYVFDTVAGKLINRIKVGTNPHGLTVWPQPGNFSLGHTGNMR